MNSNSKFEVDSINKKNNDSNDNVIDNNNNFIDNNNNIIDNDNDNITNNDTTLTTNNSITSVISKEKVTDTLKNNLINEILPPKPEIFLSKSSSTELKKDDEKREIQFSESIQSQHDSLTNDLISTIQLIKRNNLNIQKQFKIDDEIISEASDLLVTNSDSMKREGKNLKTFSKSAWMNFWKMLMILLFVSFTFLFVYIFIRLT